MGIVESIRGVVWARRRSPDQPAYVAALAHERFSPPDLLRQAVEAEEAGFDGVCCSDHLAPWWAPGEPAPAHCGNAWVWLGAVAQATRQVSIGSAVTGIAHRYNPVVVAQQIATLESLAPGRAFLGVGSGEAMNEVPAGMDWPPPDEQLARTEEALTIITGLLDGRTVDFRGQYFRANSARLYDRPERRPPVYMSAFGPQAAEIAGRLADGVWCLADPQTAPAVIPAYRRGAEQAGREPGEIILQGLVAAAESDDAAFEGAREWKATLVDEHYTDDVHDPAEVHANGENVADSKFKAMGILSADPSTHVKKIKVMQQLGATAIVLMNVSGADPHGTLRMYGEHVLPALRD
ncbi:MAG TPA: TIGR03557 family F420-dependent LLM class oxidoreductase [Solirubrobacter sp.]|nr:TIGR03557 family F420-dependent LLM class oxidoreductase [Solirubrobacter sp.]